MLPRTFCFVGAAFLVAACGTAPQPGGSRTAAQSSAEVRALADAYLDGYFERNPDAVTLFGVPGRPQDKLPDNSLDALKSWQAKEDAWLARAKAIDPSSVVEAPLRATYAI